MFDEQTFLWSGIFTNYLWNNWQFAMADAWDYTMIFSVQYLSWASLHVGFSGFQLYQQSFPYKAS